MSLTTYTLTIPCRDGAGAAVPGAKGVAELFDSAGRRPLTDYLVGGVIVATRIEFTADANGDASVDLVSNLDGNQDSRWRITATHPTTGAQLIRSKTGDGALVQMPRAASTLTQLVATSPVTVSSEAGAAESASIATDQAVLSAAARAGAEAQRILAEEAADSVLLDAGFQAVSTDLTGANTIGIVAAISAEVAAAGSVSAQIVVLAALDAEIETLALRSADLEALGPHATAIQTAADNIDAIIAAPAEADRAETASNNVISTLADLTAAIAANTGAIAENTNWIFEQDPVA